MASKDQNKEKEGGPNLPTAPFQWGAFLSAVKDQIPSMDSDTLVSDCDEDDGELFIFQRDQSDLVPDFSEELEDLPPEEAHLQKTFEFMRHPRETWNEDGEDSAFQKDKSPRRHVLLDRDGFGLVTEEKSNQEAIAPSVSSMNENKPGEGISGVPRDQERDIRENKGRLSSSPDTLPSVEVSPFLMLNTSEKERRKLIETKILSKATLGPPSGELGHPQPKNNNNNLEIAEQEPGAISAEHPRELMLFAFKDIEKWNLDKVLQDLEKQSGDRNCTVEAAFSSANHEAVRAQSQTRLMGKLEELCLKQSRAFFSHRRRCLAKFPNFSECQGDGRDVPILASWTNGQNLPPIELQRFPEPPTVYIDLRDTTPQRSESLADEQQSSSGSSTDEEEEEEMEVTDREKVEEGMKEFPQPSRKGCTAKSFLLQQLRYFRKTSQSSPVAQDKEKCQNLKSSEENDQLGVRRRQSLKLRRPTSTEPENSKSSARSFPALDLNSVARSSRELKEEPKKGSNRETPRDSADKDTGYPRTEESQKEKQGEEKRRKQRLKEQLENLKPQHSTTGKQPMAEQTPVLFHTVPCLGARGESKAPFQVLGLQQIWYKDGLALHACLTPVSESEVHSSRKHEKEKEKQQQSPSTSYLKPKNSLQGMSLFHQQSSVFLSQTSLLDVIWWKAQLDSHMQNQSYPFLPEIPPIHLSHFATLNSDSMALEKVFAVPAGFYWQTVETDEKYFPSGSDIRESSDTDSEVAMALLFETLLRSPLAVHHTLQLILASGLDICGFRLLYPQPDMFLSSTVTPPSCYTQEKGPSVLALSLRGQRARGILQDIMGPSDTQLARVTDCHSISAIYGSSRAEPLAYLPHMDSRVHRELCFWFGGRVSCDGTLHGGVPNPVGKCSKPRLPRPSLHKADADQEPSNLQDATALWPPAALVSTTKGDIILMASPAVPPHIYGLVISTCTQRGFVLQGTKQLQLSPKQAHVLGVPASQVTVFCPREASYIPERSFLEDKLPSQTRVHCLALLLRKENASHHVPALLKGLMSALAEKGFLEDIQSNLHSHAEPELSLCFHAVPYTDSLLQELGGNFSVVPDPSNIPLEVLHSRMYASEPEMEQVVLLTFTGKEAMKSTGSVLHQILALGCRKQPAQTPVLEDLDLPFELLTLKWLPHLTRIQAKETTPFEVGDKRWQTSIDSLMSSPALVCVLRRIGAFVVLAEILKRLTPHNSKVSSGCCSLLRVMSSTPETAFRQAALFFTEKDFVGDPKRRPALKYLPPPPQHPQSEAGETDTSHAELLFRSMQVGAQILCTVLLLKPGTWTRNLARILRKLDLEKFSLVGMKHIDLTPKDVRALLSSEAKQDPAALEAHSSYLTSGSSLVLCLQRQNAVKKLLDLLGPEDPKEAQAANQFFWRAQYGHSLIHNGFYGSTSYWVAVRDVELFFPEGLCGAGPPSLEGKEICTAASDPTACLEIDKQHRLVKREARRQLNLLGPEQPQTLECSQLSVLCQATCLILPETSLWKGSPPPYLVLLERLIGQGFLVTGARLTTMDEPRACFISAVLSATDREAPVMCSQLLKGTCLIIAAQRDNAVVCFDALLSSDHCQKQAVSECMKQLLYPKTEKQAEELLCVLFDSLTSDSSYQIEIQDP
uniref:Dynein axonemal assembly factor 8 n=1 Tax=Podarcis muralis TaxID=64176 RepID=A0A670JHR1_PODMU